MNDAVATKLLEAVVARLCHDLIGPVGAVHNGVELAEESDTQAEAQEMIAMVKESAVQAWGRLAFFRAAFGSGGGQDSWSGKEILDLLTRGLATKRLSFAVSGLLEDPEAEISLQHARIAFGLAMGAADSLPRGGVVTVVASGNAASPAVSAVGEGDRAEIRDEIEAALAGGPPEPRAAHVHLLNARVASMGLSVSVEADDGRTTWKAA